MNPYSQLQEDVAARLRASSYLANVPVITEQIGDIDAAVEQALAVGGALGNADSKAGLSITVITPSGTRLPEQRGSILLLDVTVRVTIYENGVVNRGESGIGKPPLEVLFAVQAALHGWRMSPGAVAVQCLAFDSTTEPEGTSYFADFSCHRAINLT